MSAALHLAKPQDLPKLVGLAMAFHAEMGFKTEETALERAIIPLLEGSPYGAIYLIGPNRAPIGYATLTFTWSLEFAGMISTLDELFVRPTVRKRGIGTEVLMSLCKTMSEADVKAMFLEVNATDENAARLYLKARFEKREQYATMVKYL